MQNAILGRNEQSVTDPQNGPSTQAASSLSASRRLNRAFFVLSAVALFALALIHHPLSGWNVNTRLNLVFAIVDRGKLSIDEYHETPPYETGDKALFEGHYYSDKTFGATLPAFPVYWLATKINRGALDFQPAHFLIRVCGVALPGAIGAGIFFLLLARLGAPPRRAVVLTAFALFGTMWYGYGTTFYPYATGMAASLGALYLVFYPPAERITAANSIGTGMLLGYVMLCDLIFGLVVVAIAIVWLFRMLDQVGVFGSRAFAEMKGDRSRAKHLIVYTLLATVAGILPLTFFAAYCYAIFGSFTIPYEYEADPLFREGMQQGVMGVTSPKLSVMYLLTLHPYRGIFLWSPILIAALCGLVLATRQYGKRRIVGWLGIWSFFAYLIFNGSYYMWWGGWSMGPRLLLPMFPFVLLGLGELARAGKLSAFENTPRLATLAWRTTCTLGIISLALCLPLSLTDPQVQQGNQTPDLLAPSFAPGYDIPQFHYLKTFYSGHVTIWLPTRLRGEFLGENRAANIALITLFLGVIAAGLWQAARLAPEKMPDTLRKDYPFRTVDGTAAPPPPKN